MLIFRCPINGTHFTSEYAEIIGDPKKPNHAVGVEFHLAHDIDENRSHDTLFLDFESPGGFIRVGDFPIYWCIDDGCQLPWFRSRVYGQEALDQALPLWAKSGLDDMWPGSEYWQNLKGEKGCEQQ